MNEKKIHPDWTFNPSVTRARQKSPNDSSAQILVNQSTPKEISERLHTTDLKCHEEPGRTKDEVDFIRSKQELTFQPQISAHNTPNRVTVAQRIEAEQQ